MKTDIKIYKDAVLPERDDYICTLGDVLECIVTEELNGAYELQMKISCDGYSNTIDRYQLYNRNLIEAKPNPSTKPQFFRIYDVSQNLDGVIEVNASHISYDMSGIPVAPFSYYDFLSKFFDAIQTPDGIVNPFKLKIIGDQNPIYPFSVLREPTSLKAILGGDSYDSILSFVNAEVEYDNTTVYLYTGYKKRGNPDHKFRIIYGKNLMDFSVDKTDQNVISGIMPYYANEESVMLLPEQIVFAPWYKNREVYNPVVPVSFTDQFPEAPSYETLRQFAVQWLEDYALYKVTTMSIDIEIINDSPIEGIKARDICLGDTAIITIPAANIYNKFTRCVKTEYNALSDEYQNVIFGKNIMNIADTIANNIQRIENVEKNIHVVR